MLMDDDGSATPRQALETLKEASIKVQKELEDSDFQSVAAMIECRRSKTKEVIQKIKMLQQKVDQMRRKHNVQIKKLERSVKNEFQTLYKALQEGTPLPAVRTGRRGAGQSIQKGVRGRGRGGGRGGGGTGAKKTGRSK